MQEADRIDELLDRWEAARDRGIEVSAEVLCANFPDLLPQVSAKLELLQRTEKRLQRRVDGTSDPLIGSSSTLEVAWGCRLIRLLAEGGLGRVYLAKDLQIERLLAVKFLRPERRSDPEQRERFLVEAKLTGALAHPSIVPILGIGRTEDDLPFYVMPLIEGRTLAEAIDAFHQRFAEDAAYVSTREFHELLRSFITLCRAIAFAHGRHVLHRDVKPQNVILGRFDETIVLDWGLATLLQPAGDVMSSTIEERKLLQTTLRLRRKISAKEGTLPYMSPELHLGIEELSPAADVYALGVTLFRLLTGRLPIETADRQELVRRIMSGDHPTAGELRRGCPEALSRIAARAMESSPSRRTAGANEVADAIEEWLLAAAGREPAAGGWMARMLGRGRRVDAAGG